jgi:hypothetical protein
MFNKTEYELDKNPKKALRLIPKVEKIFSLEMRLKPCGKIGKYSINYNPSILTFGQYIELAYYLHEPFKNAHLVLASIVSADADTHKERSEYFLSFPMDKTIGCIQKYMECLHQFNSNYISLFGSEGGEETSFSKKWGWIYSAQQVAIYENIPLDAAFGLPVTRAFNDLAFLKAKYRFEEEQLKKN